MADTTLSFNVLAKDNASRTISKIGSSFGGLHTSVGKVSKGIGALAPLLGGLAVGAGLKSFIDDARESAKVSRITENAIRATGGAAKISAAQVGALATSISNKTAIDDEQIQTAANMLLTFKNIRNETGKNNDIFNQATQAAADLSVQFGGIDGASKQLGKALNDPIKGTTALAKAGVTFTEQQKKQIKTLVESGNVLGAQKIILKEIQGQVGGAAAAAADPMERLKVVAGNLSEEIGGFLLPAVDKFANFAMDTLIPGVQALFAAFQEGDVTSDGFVGVMERIGVAARSAFGFFKTEVLPRLKEFGGFLIGTAVPAVASFGRNLVATLGPAVKDVFGFFKTEVLPRLQDFAGFLGSSVLPKIGQMATSLSKNKDFLVPFAGTIVAVVAALKTWAVVQGILNVVLSANPIGLVVVAIAALVGGLVWAYKNSETFRKIVDGAFRAVRAAAVFMWDNYLKPMFNAFVAVLKVVWERAQTFGRITGAAFTAIKEPARIAIKFVVDKFLDLVETILTGASKAFGWVPGIGPKLRGAVTEFQKFRTGVNKALDGVKDQSIDFEIRYTDKGVNLSTPSSVGRRAGGGPGGPVYGPGGTTSDKAGLYALSNKEWVIKAASSMKYGDSAMASVNAGTATIIPDGGFARGGRPGLNVNVNTGSAASLAKSVTSTVKAIVRPVAAALAKASGPLQRAMNFGRSQAGKPYVWGGVGPNGYDCSGFVSALINVAQGRTPYRRLGATGSMPWSMMAPGAGRFSVGWFKGNPGHTAATINGTNFESRGGRGVVVGPGARGANNSLFNRLAHVKGFASGGRVDGDLPYDLLKGNRDLVKTLLFDGGGILPPGRSVVENRTGKPEPLARADQRLSDPAMVAALERAFRRALTDARLRIEYKGGQVYGLLTTNG